MEKITWWEVKRGRRITLMRRKSWLRQASRDRRPRRTQSSISPSYERDTQCGDGGGLGDGQKRKRHHREKKQTHRRKKENRRNRKSIQEVGGRRKKKRGRRERERDRRLKALRSS